MIGNFFPTYFGVELLLVQTTNARIACHLVGKISTLIIDRKDNEEEEVQILVICQGGDRLCRDNRTWNEGKLASCMLAVQSLACQALNAFDLMLNNNT